MDSQPKPHMNFGQWFSAVTKARPAQNAFEAPFEITSMPCGCHRSLTRLAKPPGSKQASRRTTDKRFVLRRTSEGWECQVCKKILPWPSVAGFVSAAIADDDRFDPEALLPLAEVLTQVFKRPPDSHDPAMILLNVQPAVRQFEML